MSESARKDGLRCGEGRGELKNDEKDLGAELTGQPIPDVDDTEPRPNCNDRGLYHHFVGGKCQCGAEALRALVESVAERSDAFNDKLLVVPREAYDEAVRALKETDSPLTASEAHARGIPVFGAAGGMK